MRDFLKSAGHWVRVGWFWPLALLTFPMCALFVEFEIEDPPPFAFDPGPSPVSSAIMCDIPKFNGSRCADADEAADGMSLAHGAIALNLGETNPLVLDFSSDATAACGGLPKLIEFTDRFPTA